MNHTVRNFRISLVTAAVWFFVWFAVAGGDRHAGAAVVPAGGTDVPEAISVSTAATDLEVLAAKELQRYAYLRSGVVLPVRRGLSGGSQVVVTRKDRALVGDRGGGLEPQQFSLRTESAGGRRVWWILGGDEVGVLYGAYRFAEKLGIRFGLNEDAVPDGPPLRAWPEVNETGLPRFQLRGLQPFHDFSVGPDWWNADDYVTVLSQMAKLRLNFIGLHTYPSWNPATGPEANVWIGLPEDVDRRGNVRFGYEAGVATTRRGWAVKPFPTSRYASGAGLLFEGDDFGPDFMQECLDWPRSPEAARDMFNRYGDVQARVFRHAARLGIKTCVGTELPLGIPPALRARLERQGMNPDDPMVLQRLYEGTFLRVMRKTPVDYYWFWTPEVWLGMEPGCKDWEITSRENVARDLELATAAARSARVPFRLATGGWRLGTREDPLWLDRRTPKSWAASSIGTGLGRDPVEAAFGLMAGRPKWVISWAEDDDTAGAHCCTCWDLQLWVERMFLQAEDARRYGCEGMMAIHWRTAAVSPNMEALARAGWDFQNLDGSEGRSGRPLAPQTRLEEHWADWGRGWFGEAMGPEIARHLRKLDGCHPAINALIRGGAGTTEAQIDALFLPLRELEDLRPSLQGVGNLERFDYWLNTLRASRHRVRTWVLADRLTRKMKEIESLPQTEARREAAHREVLPLRLSLARSYELLIAAHVDAARSPGEVGTVASIEAGSRDRLVTAHDPSLATILGQPLPEEAVVRTSYRGQPRIFVSPRRTHLRAGEPLELRAFVLSANACARVNLHWRRLGEGPFRKAVATHRGRHAFRAVMPAKPNATWEYYLEAVLEDGRTVRWPTGAPGRCQTVVGW